MISVAKVLIYDAAENVLVLQRSASHPIYAHEFDLPGGMIEDGETPISALIREISEETGLQVKADAVIFAHERIAANLRHDSIYTLSLDTVKPDISISWEHESYQWVQKDSLLSKLETQDDYMIVVLELLTL
jgi:8-oxo-dGTP pyrophosphatase MutT (NUDIX family)